MKLTAAILFGAAAIAACFVSRPSEDFQCETTADCDSGRQCQANYCVIPNCPSDCTSCDELAKTCQVDCTSAASCDTIECPSGWACTITCTGDNACSGVNCRSGSKCQVTCTGLDACETVDCDAACSCDVSCSEAGACNPPSCPVVGNGANQVQCTTDGANGSPCDSARAAGCTKC